MTIMELAKQDSLTTGDRFVPCESTNTGDLKAECDAAHLRAAQGAKPFGQPMLIDVQDRLQRVAKEESNKVANQPFEALIGMAGLLTESCPVWWSEKFDMEDQP